jgi:hypothetical protein
MADDFMSRLPAWARDKKKAALDAFEDGASERIDLPATVVTKADEQRRDAELRESLPIAERPSIVKKGMIPSPVLVGKSALTEPMVGGPKWPTTDTPTMKRPEPPPHIKQAQDLAALRAEAKRTGRLPLSAKNVEVIAKERQRAKKARMDALASGIPEWAAPAAETEIVPGVSTGRLASAPYRAQDIIRPYAYPDDKLRSENPEPWSPLDARTKYRSQPHYVDFDEEGNEVLVPVGSMRERRPKTEDHPGYFLSSRPEQEAQRKVMEAGGMREPTLLDMLTNPDAMRDESILSGPGAIGPAAVAHKQAEQMKAEGVSPAFVSESDLEWANRNFNLFNVPIGVPELVYRMGKMIYEDPERAKEAMRDTPMSKGAPGSLAMVAQRMFDWVPETAEGLGRYYEERGPEGILADTGLMRLGSIGDSRATPGFWPWLRNVLENSMTEVPMLAAAPFHMLYGTLGSGDMAGDVQKYVGPGVAGAVGLIAEAGVDPEARVEKGAVSAALDQFVLAKLGTGPLAAMERRSNWLRSRGTLRPDKTVTVDVNGTPVQKTIKGSGFISAVDSAKQLHAGRRTISADLAKKGAEFKRSVKEGRVDGLAQMAYEAAKAQAKSMDELISRHALNNELADAIVNAGRMLINPILAPSALYRIATTRALLGKPGSVRARWLSLTKQDRLPTAMWEVMQEARGKIAADELRLHEMLDQIPTSQDMNNVRIMLQQQHGLHVAEGLRMFDADPAKNLVAIERTQGMEPRWTLTPAGRQATGLLTDTDVEVFLNGGQVRNNPTPRQIEARANMYPHIRSANEYGRGLVGMLDDTRQKGIDLGLFYNADDLMDVWMHDAYRSTYLEKLGYAIEGGGEQSVVRAILGDSQAGKWLDKFADDLGLNDPSMAPQPGWGYLGPRQAKRKKQRGPDDLLAEAGYPEARKLSADQVSGNAFRESEMRRLALEESQEGVPFAERKYNIEKRESLYGQHDDLLTIMTRGLMQTRADLRFLETMKKIEQTPGYALNEAQYLSLLEDRPDLAAGFSLAPSENIVPSYLTNRRRRREAAKLKALERQKAVTERSVKQDQIDKLTAEVEKQQRLMDDAIRETGQLPSSFRSRVEAFAGGYPDAKKLYSGLKRREGEANKRLAEAKGAERQRVAYEEAILDVSDRLDGISSTAKAKMVTALGGTDEAKAAIDAAIDGSTGGPALSQLQNAAEYALEVAREELREIRAVASVRAAAERRLNKIQGKAQGERLVQKAAERQQEKIQPLKELPAGLEGGAAVVAKTSADMLDLAYTDVINRASALRGRAMSAAEAAEDLLKGGDMEVVEGLVGKSLKRGDGSSTLVDERIWTDKGARAFALRQAEARVKSAKAAVSDVKAYERTMTGSLQNWVDKLDDMDDVLLLRGDRIDAQVRAAIRKSATKATMAAFRKMQAQARLADLNKNAAKAQKKIADLEPKIAKQKEVAERAAVQHKTLGPLANKYVDNDILYELVAAQKLAEDMHGIFRGVDRAWKMGKTAWSIATTVRNVITNALLFAPMAGISILNPGTWKAYKGALMDMAAPVNKRSATWKAAYESGRLRSDQITNEMRTQGYGLKGSRGLLNNVDDLLMNAPSIITEWAFRAPTNNWSGAFESLPLRKSTARALARWGRSAMATPGKFYAAMDEVFRVAYFHHKIGKKPEGVSQEDWTRQIADEFAEKFVDYSAVPGWVRVVNSGFAPPKMVKPLGGQKALTPGRGGWLEKTAGVAYALAGQPFISFVAQSVPMFLKWMEQNPVRGSIYKHVFDTMMDMQYGWLGMDYEKEKARLKTLGAWDRAAGMVMGAVAPSKSRTVLDDGSVAYNVVFSPGINVLGPYTQGQDFTGNFANWLRSVGAQWLNQGPPMVKTAYELLRNRSDFGGRSIMSESLFTDPMKSIGQAVTYGARAMLPPETPEIPIVGADFSSTMEEAKGRLMKAFDDGAPPIQLSQDRGFSIEGTTTARRQRAARGDIDYRGRRTSPEQETRRMYSGTKTGYMTLDDSLFNALIGYGPALEEARRFEAKDANKPQRVTSKSAGLPDEREAIYLQFARKFDENQEPARVREALGSLVQKNKPVTLDVMRSEATRQLVEETRFDDDPPAAAYQAGESYDWANTSPDALAVLSALDWYETAANDTEKAARFEYLVSTMRKAVDAVRRRRGERLDAEYTTYK